MSAAAYRNNNLWKERAGGAKPARRRRGLSASVVPPITSCVRAVPEQIDQPPLKGRQVMGNPLTYVAINGPHTTNSPYSNFQNIPGMSVTAEAATGDQFLVTLTVPDTWNDTAGGRGWFAITCNSNIIARGLFTSAVADQRVPISLQAVVTATPGGTYQFAGQFCSEIHGVVHIGGWSQSWLTVLRVV